MEDSSESRKTKDRSPNFPFISLEYALDRAKQFYDEERRGFAPFPVAAEHWSYSPSSSGALQTAAALKSYGLMEDEGTGRGRKLRLTDLALRILLDARPDSSERDRYKRQAALSPSISSVIYENWPTVPPSDATLHHFLVLELQFNESTAYKVSKIIKDNYTFAKLYKSDSESRIDEIDKDNSPQAIGDVLRINREALPKSALNTEQIIGPDGIIILQFSGEPTWASYDFLSQYIELRKKLLKPSPTRQQSD